MFIDCPCTDDKRMEIQDMASLVRSMLSVIIFVIPSFSTAIGSEGAEVLFGRIAEF